MPTDNVLNIPSREHGEEVLALGRIVSYACQQASRLNLDLSRHLLEVALLAVMEDIQLSGVTLGIPSKPVSVELESKVH